MMQTLMRPALAAAAVLIISSPNRADDTLSVEHGFVDSDGVKIHYVTAGTGPLVVMIHGFPDYWYTWRKQIPVLAEHFRVVAIDQRGYNRSDQPDGADNYTIERLTGDLKAVVRHFGDEPAVIIGHDWGGMVAWQFAMTCPELTDRLVVLNLPHPAGFLRELAENPAQQAASEYARNFRRPDAWKTLTAPALAFWVTDADARSKYIEAFERSSFEAMLNYYVANFPDPPPDPATIPISRIMCPVLVIHGMNDPAILPAGHNSTWDHVDNDVTLVMIRKAGHFVQQDAADKVTRTIDHWLRRDQID